MRKIISLSFISLSLLVLVNCSPKTAKTTTASKTTSTSERSSSSAGTSSSASPSSTSSSSSSSNGVQPWAGKTTDEQIDMFKNANPERQDIGKKVYIANCGKCHELHAVETRDAASWVNVMKEMGPKAKLDNTQYMHVSSYLVNNAKR